MASDSEEDMKKAIALSLADVPQNGTTSVESAETKTVQSALAGLMGLDRKTMEEERLARLARKRQRSISPPAVSSPRKAPKLETKTVTLASGARLTSFSAAVTADQQDRKTGTANAANQRLSTAGRDTSIKQEHVGPDEAHVKAQQQGSIQYPNGVVKKTWAFGHPRDGHDVKLEEVLEPATLKTAVLSAYQWNTDWVLSKLKTPLNGGHTKCVFVMQAKEDALRQQMLQDTQDVRSFLRLCFPPMPGQTNCMHSKLMLLFHPDKLRIAIPTANLLNFDWGETGVMENSVWMIDLPRLPEGGKSEHDDLTAFGKELLHYLEMQTLDQNVRTGILSFDFAATEGMMFVHTAGGMHYGENAERTGLPGLGRAVRHLHLETDGQSEIDFAASSIGSLKDEFLQNLHAAACGEDMIDRAEALATKAKTGFFNKTGQKAQDEKSNIREKVRIYFPTQETVKSSTAGAAGTICLSREWFEGGKFPRTCFRDYRSSRTGLLSHNKLLYVRGTQQCTHCRKSKDVAWAYVGSANFSESAWGKLVYERKEKAWKINCRNWECGVLLPVPGDKLPLHECKKKLLIKKETIDGEDSETQSENGSAEGSETESEGEGDGVEPATNGVQRSLVGMQVFDDVAKPPFELPGSRYGGQQPWYFKESA